MTILCIATGQMRLGKVAAEILIADLKTRLHKWDPAEFALSRRSPFMPTCLQQTVNVLPTTKGSPNIIFTLFLIFLREGSSV